MRVGLIVHTVLMYFSVYNMNAIVVPYTNCTNCTIGEKFRNSMELYEFYVLLDNLSSLHSSACSTQYIPALAP